jgi:hypothetical protein
MTAKTEENEGRTREMWFMGRGSKLVSPQYEAPLTTMPQAPVALDSSNITSENSKMTEL